MYYTQACRFTYMFFPARDAVMIISNYISEKKQSSERAGKLKNKFFTYIFLTKKSPSLIISQD